MRISSLLATLSLSALVLCAETDYRFAFPQSELLMGIDVKWLMKSPFGTTLRREAKANLGELQPLESLLERVDSVHLSVISKTSKTSDVLIMVQGNFQLEELTELGMKNGLRLEQWGKVKVLTQPRTKKTPARKAPFQKVQFSMDMPETKPFFALLDDHRILIGEEAPLRVGLERLETGLAPKANPLFERALDLEAGNDLWLVGNTAPLNLNAASTANDPMAKYASQIRNFSIGIAIRRNVAMDLQLQASSPKIAAEMLDLAKGAMAMAKLSAKPEEPLPVDLDKVLQLSSSGNLVKATLTIDQADVEKLMASALTTGAKATKDAIETTDKPVVVARPEPAKPVEPARKTVMIYGLPGGPKEVPVQ